MYDPEITDHSHQISVSSCDGTSTMQHASPHLNCLRKFIKTEILDVLLQTNFFSSSSSGSLLISIYMTVSFAGKFARRLDGLMPLLKVLRAVRFWCVCWLLSS